MTSYTSLFRIIFLDSVLTLCVKQLLLNNVKDILFESCYGRPSFVTKLAIYGPKEIYHFL
jgi:hypothetical protein